MKTLTEREAHLLTKAVEGALSAEEQREWDQLLRANPALEQEYLTHTSLKEVTMSLHLRKPPEETWERYWAGVYARLERGLAWAFISIGAAMVLAYAGYQAVAALLSDATLPLIVRVAVAVLLFGAAVLFVSVLREKWFTHKSDKYREVIR